MELGISLLDHLGKFSSPPYLFVGSGMARRYLGLEDWAGLMRKLCEIHQLDYGYLRTQAGGDLAEFATLAAAELQKVWWTEKDYLDSRAEFEDVATDSESAFKIETSRYIRSAAILTEDPELLVELELFRNIVVDGIVTTNWDNLLETLFPGHVVYVGQEGLIFSQIQGIAEIYKIHGTREDPQSLVLTTSDYEEFHKKNPYLASKLITFFVENPVVFLGYSLADKNILSIIHSILDCLSKENVLKLADRLVFVQWDSGCVEPRFERTILTHGGRSLPVYQGTTASMSDVLGALGKIKRKIPAKLLRVLKKQVFNLVHTTDPGEKIFVKDINEDTPEGEIEFAIGVGILEKLRDKGYVALKREDILRDFVYGDLGLKVDAVVKNTLPEVLKTSRYVPIFKYLRAFEAMPGYDAAELPDRIKDAKKRTLATYRKTKGSGQVVESARGFVGDFNAFANANSFERTMSYWQYLPAATLDVDQLHDFLIMHFDDCFAHSQPGIWTSYCKLACVYDILRFDSL